MKTIDFACPSCARVLKVSEEHIGKSGTCNHCGGTIVVSSVPQRNAEVDDQSRALEAIAQNPDSLERLIDEVYRFLTTFLGCDFQGKALLFLMDEQAGGLRLAETRGQFSPEFLQEEAFVPLGQCLCGRVAQTGQVLVCEDCFHDARHETRWLGMDTHGHYVLPLTHEGRLLGVLSLYTRAGAQVDSQQMALLTKVGEQAGAGLQRLLRMDTQTSAS